MKRCPECDFLYEDDQRLCDMDGTTLIHDSHVFPDSPLPHQVARHVWQRMAIALPLMVLAVLGFYVLKQQPRTQTNHSIEMVPVQSSSNAAAVSNSEVRMTGAGTTVSEPIVEKEAEASHADVSKGTAASKATSGAARTEDPNTILTAPESSADTKATPTSATPSAKPTERRVRPQNTPVRKVSAANDQGKDSKVASFFKKTGRILKKPFKL